MEGAQRGILGRVGTLLRTGFFHIVGAGALNKVLSALLSIVLVRLLSKIDYGCYAYAFNIASFFMLFSGLGATAAILQICSELVDRRAQADAVYRYGYRAGIVADALMAVAMVAVGLLVPLAVEGSNGLLMLYCLYPLITFLCEVKLVYLRVWLKNREYAYMTNLQTVVLVVFSIVGALAGQAAGLVIGQCLAHLAVYAFLCARFPFRSEGPAERLSRLARRDYWNVAGISAFNNALSAALTLVGTFLVGLLLVSDELVAEYKVATTIPFALLFLPALVATYVMPYFIRNKTDRAWTVRNFARLVGAGIVVMGAITALCEVFAEPIVIVLFGERYLDTVPVFRLLMVGFFLTAAFRQPTGNLLVTQRRLLFNAAVGVVSIAVNVAASLALIPAHGMMGAAGAYVLTMLLGAVLNVPYYAWVIARIPGEGR